MLLKTFGWLAAVVAGLFIFGCAYAQSDAPEVARVFGTLERVAAIGGETSGWAIRLDTPLTTDGEELDTLEVEKAGRDLESFEGKKVMATGTLSHRVGVERGRYTVIELSEISEMK